MSKLSCNIIKDLLPLYIDKVCSSDTVEAVEEHIKGCPLCEAELLNLHNDTDIKPEIDKDIDKAVKNANKKIKNGKKKVVIKTLSIILIITMVLGTIYVKMLFNEYDINFLWYVGFALIGYVIAQMLLVKSFRILKYWKGFVGYVTILLLIVVGIKIDFIGFEKRVPDVENIEMAVVDYYYSSKYFREDDVESNADVNILKEKSNIEKVTKLHQYLINNRLEDKEYTRTIQIGYKLKNGRFIEREYEIDYNDKSTIL